MSFKFTFILIHINFCHRNFPHSKYKALFLIVHMNSGYRVVTRLITLCFSFLPLFLHFSPLFFVYFSILSLYLSLDLPVVLIFIATTLWKLSCILTEQSLFQKRVWQFVAVLKLTPLVTILTEVCHTFLMYLLGL